MLSRFAASRQVFRWSNAKALSTSAPAAADSQRDLVNFPKRVRAQECGPVRLKIFPEEWFTAFHSKTGATGPYVLLGTLGTFLMSKEIVVFEHEFIGGLSLACVLFLVNRAIGPDIRAEVDKLMDEREAELKAVRQDEIDRCKAAIESEENAQVLAGSYEALIAAKKENIGLQLEKAYRERLQEAYTQVRRRLDYQLEVSNVMRRVEQKHMVDWIINNVKTSITKKQEDDALKKCVSDLKAMV